MSNVAPRASSYQETVVPMTTLPILLLRNLIRLGFTDYMMSVGGEVRLALGNIAEVTVDCETVAIRGSHVATRVEPARDPFEQVGRLLGSSGLGDWRAYGYIGFDVSRFYFPYKKAMSRPLLRMFVPEIECRVVRGKLHVKSVGDVARVVQAMSVTSDFVTHPARKDLLVHDPADHDRYLERVTELIAAIKRGELEKAILARARHIPGRLDVLGTHTHASEAAKHTIFPVRTTARPHQQSWSYCFEIGDTAAVGSSPEVFLRASAEGELVTNPLAGTRPRGDHAALDDQLRRELFTDAKEVKEHAISIRLAQEELESVCAEGTTKIADFMEVKQFRFVQHLSSRVGGKLEKGRSVWDAIRAIFPAVTVSGIEKAPALAMIDRFEDFPRGIYGGAVGWVDHTGASDLAIAIRAVYQYGDAISLNAGAGIVAESDPESEYLESHNKMRTMATNLVLAE
ncbi:MAG: salicylate synthase [Polyangiales bacterium]